jgi:hypothetical protein
LYSGTSSTYRIEPCSIDSLRVGIQPNNSPYYS